MEIEQLAFHAQHGVLRRSNCLELLFIFFPSLILCAISCYYSITEIAFLLDFWSATGPGAPPVTLDISSEYSSSGLLFLESLLLRGLVIGASRGTC